MDSNEELGSCEAKTRLPELLRRLKRGESFTITIHGKAVADIVPSSRSRKERARTAIANLLAARKSTVSAEELATLKEAGRR